MKLLEPDNYYVVTELLEQVPFNKLFARSIVEKHISGKVYADNPEDPKSIYIVHPYKMSLLLGETNNRDFNSWLLEYALNKDKLRKDYEWMQVYPDSWDNVLEKLFGDHLVKSSDNAIDDPSKIELNTRVNFRFNREKYQDFKRTFLIKNYKITRTDSVTYNLMTGHVVPMHFWENAEHFLNHGVGFSLFYENKLASTAYSAFVIDNYLEIGIETVEEFRGKGLAQYSCATLIDYCLQHNYEPVWSCRLENMASYRLAQKLGFEPILERSYYRLGI